MAKRPSATVRPDVGASGAPRHRNLTWLSAGLLALVAIVYWPVAGHGFVNWDDPVYVTGNARVIGGLSWEGTAWAFTSTYAANWHPLTWLSHMLDVQLFGMNPGAHHTTNVLLHVVSTVLLFGWLQRTTGSTGPSAFVAALFAVHPAHVESVAWIAERKDVLSALFLMLTLWAYTAYACGQSLRRYLLVLAVFGLGLMAKPMLVTVPLLLLLLDVWPLRRVEAFTNVREALQIWLPLLREKLPLLALSLGSAVVTLFAQSRGGAVVTLDASPLVVRLANAVVSYVAYLGKTFWPVRLAVVYPYRGNPAPWMVIGALLILFAATVVAVRSFRSRPYVFVGWLWYLITLVPVIGVVQIGAQSIADRYTYIPLIGLFMIVAWGVPELFAATSALRRAIPVSAVTATAACAVLARMQVRHWRDDVVLWERAIAVTEGNSRAHNNLAIALTYRGLTEDAIGHYREAIRLNPRFGEARTNLATTLASRGLVAEAAAEYEAALRLNPDYLFAHNGIGTVLAGQGRLDEAIEHFRQAVRIDPRSAWSHSNLGTALVNSGKEEEGLRELLEAVRLEPSSAAYHYSVAVVLVNQGNTGEARRHLEHTLTADPSHRDAREVLERLGTPE